MCSHPPPLDLPMTLLTTLMTWISFVISQKAYLFHLPGAILLFNKAYVTLKGNLNQHFFKFSLILELKFFEFHVFKVNLLRAILGSTPSVNTCALTHITRR